MSLFRCSLCGELFDLSQQQSIDVGMNYDPRCFSIMKNNLDSYNKRIHDAMVESRSTMLIESLPFEKEEPPTKGKKKQPKTKYDNRNRNGR